MSAPTSSRLRVSVVIPVKDDATELDRCLAALSAQWLQPFEVIVVDNGSTDATAQVARRHGSTVLRERRPGITAAAAAGYDAAAGDVIARCDADSVPPPQWLARIERTLRRYPEVAAVTGRGRFGSLGPVRRALADVLYMHAYFVTATAAAARTPLFGSNFAMRAEVWRSVSDAVPRDRPELHDDLDLSYRLPIGADVRYDTRLVVGISARPFSDPRSMRRRFDRAFVTIAGHEPAWRRWRSRLRWMLGIERDPSA